jgi:hypothetical protein
VYYLNVATGKMFLNTCRTNGVLMDMRPLPAVLLVEQDARSALATQNAAMCWSTGATCVRVAPANSPVTSGASISGCNAGAKPVWPKNSNGRKDGQLRLRKERHVPIRDIYFFVRLADKKVQ